MIQYSSIVHMASLGLCYISDSTLEAVPKSPEAHLEELLSVELFHGPSLRRFYTLCDSLSSRGRGDG